jgi:hypothetical protein
MYQIFLIYMFIRYCFVLIVEKKMDKTWMTKSRDMGEYRDGCRLFVDFAIRNCKTLMVKCATPVSHVEIISDTILVSYLRT